MSMTLWQPIRSKYYLKIFSGGRAKDTHDVVELVKVVFAREDWSVRQHLCQDAAHSPHVNRLVVALGVDHDLWCSVPSSDNQSEISNDLSLPISG